MLGFSEFVLDGVENRDGTDCLKIGDGRNE